MAGSPSASESDSRLALRHVAGDGEAFGVLVDRYVDRLLAFVMNLVEDRKRAESLVVEVFVRAFRHLHEYNPATRFGTWIHAIAADVAEREIRERRRSGHGPRWIAELERRVRQVLRRGRQAARGADRRHAVRRGTFERRKQYKSA